MTSALRLFELERYRASRLDYALGFLREHQEELGPAMADATARGLPIPVSTVDDLGKLVAEGVTIGSLALFWRGFHAYRENLTPMPSQADIERTCSQYRLRCHRDHPEDHVLRFLRDLRNTQIHPGATFRCITCNRSPDEILFQQVLIRDLPDKRL